VSLVGGHPVGVGIDIEVTGGYAVLRPGGKSLCS
jgi:hypothetical protein